MSLLEWDRVAPVLFNVYMDDVFKKLRQCKTGCVMGKSLINHLIQYMLMICSSCLHIVLGHSNCFKCALAMESNMTLSLILRSVILIVETKEDQRQKIPSSLLSDCMLYCMWLRNYNVWVTSSLMICEMTDQHQCCKLYSMHRPIPWLSDSTCAQMTLK